MKRLLMIIMSLSMLCSVFTYPAFAADSADSTSTSVTISEYDVYVQTRMASAKELAKSDVSTQQIELIKSNIIEDELVQLSKLTTDELAERGYSPNQISLLHNYNGERIENHPELRSALANVTVSFSKVTASAYFIAVQVTWKWSNSPLLSGSGITDLVAMRWAGTNPAGQPINVAFNSAQSSCTVKYDSANTQSYRYTQNAPIKCDSPYDHAYAQIPMSLDKKDDQGNYAQTGTMKIYVDRTGTAIIKEVAFVFGYGHTIILITPSLSLPASFGIGFSTGTEKMAEKAIRMSNAGNITNY